MKMPNLIEHYISHKIIDNGTTVFSFIKMHYLDEHGVDGDYHQDMKLPFKTHDVSVNVFSFVFPPKKIFPSLSISKELVIPGVTEPIPGTSFTQIKFPV